MARRRRKKIRRTDKSQTVTQNKKQITGAGTLDEEHARYVSCSAISYTTAFDDIEQRARGRLQEILSHIDGAR